MREGPAAHDGATVRALDVRALDALGLDAVEGAPERIIVLGGDGTASAVASWVIARGLDPAIAIVPAGTGDNLARDLGIPLEPETAMDLAFGTLEPEATVRRVDAFRYEGEFGARTFVQMAALGFPSDVVATYEALRRAPPLRLAAGALGSLGYKAVALAALLWARRRERRGRGIHEVRIRHREGSIEERALAVFFGNGPSTGGGFLPCPAALLDDGILDVCLVRAGTGASLLGLFRAFGRGRQGEERETVLHLRPAGPLDVELAAPARILADGDLPVRAARIRIEPLPGRLRFIVPRRGPAARGERREEGDVRGGEPRSGLGDGLGRHALRVETSDGLTRTVG